MAYSLAFHIVGLVFWLGGLAIVTRYMQVFAADLPAQASSGLDIMRTLTKKIWRGMVLGGAIISLASGLYQFFLRGADYYLSQGWFHGKLTLVVVLLVVTWFVGIEVRRADKGEKLAKGRLHALHGISSLILVLIVFLTMVGRT